MLPRYARRELIWTIIIIAALFLIFAPNSGPSELVRALLLWIGGLIQQVIQHFGG